MKILMLGSWQREKALECKKEAEEIGEILAEKGHTLISGGGEGISEIVVKAYKKNKGKKFIAYFPSKKEMQRVGENPGPKPDEVIDTNVDYTERNIIMVRNCDAAIALHGGLGTLTEIIHAIKDYGKKVAVIDKGEMAGWIKAIPEMHKKVLLTNNLKKAIEYLEK